MWLIPRSFRAPSRPKAPKNAFHATRFYNLAADNPRRPHLENALGRIETRYGALLPKLIARTELEHAEYLELTLFIGTLRFRMPEQIAHWQKQYDELARIHRQVERTHTGDERQSDAVFGVQSEMAKRLLFDHAASFAKVVAPCGWIVVNESPLPLFGSDNPAVHDFLHRDQLEATGFPLERLNPDARRSDRAFFSYCPLTPSLAFVSSPLLDPPVDSGFWCFSDPRLAVGLNEIARAHSTEYLLSHRQDPYGPLAGQLADLDAEYARRLRERGNTGALVYTDDNRYWLSCSAVQHEEGPHPLFTRIRLTLMSADEAGPLAEGTVIRELEVYEAGRPAAGMRGARVHAYNPAESLDFLIQADPSLAI